MPLQENIPYETIRPPVTDIIGIASYYSCSVLTPVLQDSQSVIDERGDVSAGSPNNSDDPAHRLSYNARERGT